MVDDNNVAINNCARCARRSYNIGYRHKIAVGSEYWYYTNKYRRLNALYTIDTFEPRHCGCYEVIFQLIHKLKDMIVPDSMLICGWLTTTKSSAVRDVYSGVIGYNVSLVQSIVNVHFPIQFNSLIQSCMLKIHRGIIISSRSKFKSTTQLFILIH